MNESSTHELPDGAARGPTGIASEARTPAGARRLLGAVLFGLAIAGYIDTAFRDLVPKLLEFMRDIDREAAVEASNTMPWLLTRLFAAPFSGGLGAGVAAYIAGRRWKTAAALTMLPMALLACATSVMIAYAGLECLAANRAEFWVGVASGALLSVSAFVGGSIGRSVSLVTRDYEATDTAFGVRWRHYLWLLPLFAVNFLQVVLIVVVFLVLAAVAFLNFSIHPSLWFSPVYWFLSLVLPVLAAIAAALSLSAPVMLLKRMHHSHTTGRMLSVLGWGVLAPTAAWLAANLGLRLVSSAPSPAPGDLKYLVAIGLLPLVCAAVGLLVSGVSRLLSRRP